MAKKKAKRYTDAQRKEILDFIEAHGYGGQLAAIKKFKVTAASIASWKKKAGGSAPKGRMTGKSKELRAVHELKEILIEIDATESKLKMLQRRYAKVKSTI